MKITWQLFLTAFLTANVGRLLGQFICYCASAPDLRLPVSIAMAVAGLALGVYLEWDRQKSLPDQSATSPK